MRSNFCPDIYSNILELVLGWILSQKLVLSKTQSTEIVQVFIMDEIRLAQ